MTKNMTRPVLRYHGGKWRMAKWIIEHFPPHDIYIEPFGGAGSVLMRKIRSRAELFNDLDGEIVNLFRVLRDPAGAKELERVVSLTPYSRSEYEAAYLSADDPIEQARRTILKSFAGFGSDAITYGRCGFRDNLTRNKIPASDWASYPNHIEAFTNRLRGVVIENRPAVELINKHDTQDTLFYCDPPYPHITRKGHGKRVHAYRHEMCDEEHRELAAALRSVKGMVVLSGYRALTYEAATAHFAFVGATGSGKSINIRLLLESIFAIAKKYRVPTRMLVYDSKHEFLPILYGIFEKLGLGVCPKLR